MVKQLSQQEVMMTSYSALKSRAQLGDPAGDCLKKGVGPRARRKLARWAPSTLIRLPGQDWRVLGMS